MKKSKIFMATGALLLAATAIFATKANKKFNGTSVNTAYSHVGGYWIKIADASAFSLLTTAAGTNQLQINTHFSSPAGAKEALFTSTSGTAKKVTD